MNIFSPSHIPYNSRPILWMRGFGTILAERERERERWAGLPLSFTRAARIIGKTSKKNKYHLREFSIHPGKF
ncbi:MAG: hypothetical protein LBJ47_08880, partial [Tannerella sp.]|nr:hypothetical protein [Tannerella sp.]